jgi:S-formylglutathione hydrolase FrmB
VRKRTDRLIAIGSLTAVAVVPTVLVLGPWGGDEKVGARGYTGPTPVADAGTGLPVPSPSPSASRTGGSPAKSPAADRVLPFPTLSSTPSSGSTPGSGGGGGGGTGSDGDSRRPADDGAKITKVQWRGKRQADVTVKSPALGTSHKVRVLVPKTWKSSANRTWPVVYAFHGGNDTYVSWTRSTDIEQYAAAYDVIVVMPEGRNGSYTDWYNNGRGGIPKWETFHMLEVRQLMERNFHAGSSRAAMGISSGAQGAVTYAARYPGMFRYAAAYSGVLSMLSPGIPALLLYINSGNGNGSPERIWGDPVRDRANWVAHDPTSLAPRLRGTSVYVSSGNGKEGPLDKPGKAPWDIGYLSETQVERASKDFVQRARSVGVSVTTNFYGPGSHSWPYWQREMHRTWPTMMRAIGARKF